MTWAFKRQFFYLTIVLVFLFSMGFLILYPYLHKPPTCEDYKQNGNETGVDCGGSCARACVNDVEKISTLWYRTFRVLPGRYNAVAYLENKNGDAAIHKIKYRFRFADKDNVYLGKREGETYVPPFGKFAVFEPAVDMGNSIPVYTTFEFTEIPAWFQVKEEDANAIRLVPGNIVLEDERTSPSLSATVRNDSLYAVPEMSVMAILYDKRGNAVSASRTYIDLLNAGEEVTVNFTWPEPIDGEVVAKEIITMFDIFLVKFE